MRIVRLEQNSEAWLLHRLGKATGSKAKFIKPLKYGGTPSGFYTLLAEKIAIPPDGERAIDRGHRLENPALERLSVELNLPIDLEPGMWESDVDSDIAISPDGAEVVADGETPTWAAEAKCLSSANHLRWVINDLNARKKDDYFAFDSIPDYKTNCYKEQVLQYFVVNEKLETLYFVLYDDRIILDQYVFHVITVKREDVEELIEQQKYEQLDTLITINKLIAELAE